MTLWSLGIPLVSDTILNLFCTEINYWAIPKLSTKKMCSLLCFHLQGKGMNAHVWGKGNSVPGGSHCSWQGKGILREAAPCCFAGC